MDLDAVEVRVLGCLIEKQRTTPDVYPLSLNSLRAACNQSTNRDPVVAYDEATIRDALHRLGRRRWTRFASGARAAKYRHLLDETPGLSVEEQSLLAVLMLRGPQTPGELRQRVERLYSFRDQDALETTLAGLIDRELRLAPRPPPGPEGGPLRAPAERGSRGRGARGVGAAPAARPPDRRRKAVSTGSSASSPSSRSRSPS